MNIGLHAMRAMVAALITAAVVVPAAKPTRAADDRPLNLVVTYPPGGGADLMARLIAPELGRALGGRRVVVENRPGGGGQIGATYVARAEPDGSTLMLDASSYSVTPSLYQRLAYKGLDAFKVVGVLALYPNVVLVNPSFEATTLTGLLDSARRRPDAIAYASSGNGSAQHLAGALFESMARVELVHVPYKGGGPAMNDVMAGQVPLFFGNLASTVSHIRSGRLKPLAVTGKVRSPLLPDVPTVAEAGVAGYVSYEWNVLVAPVGTPDAKIAELSAALRLVLQAPDIQRRIAELGGDVQPGTPQDGERFVRDEAARWSKLIRESNIRAE